MDENRSPNRGVGHGAGGVLGNGPGGVPRVSDGFDVYRQEVAHRLADAFTVEQLAALTDLFRDDDASGHLDRAARLQGGRAHWLNPR